MEAVPEMNNDSQLTSGKHKDELEHLRHERNVYEESYIRIQRELDQTQKENETLHEEINSKKDVIDGFDLRLEEERVAVSNEMEIEIKEMRSKMDEREKELVKNHLEEISVMESLIGELKVHYRTIESICQGVSHIIV